MNPITADRLFTPKKVAERLNQALERRGVEKHGRGSALARITGTSPQAAAKWLSAQVMPSVANLLRIAYAYDISLCWLLTGEGMMLVDKDFLAVADDWSHADPDGQRLIKTVSSQVRKRAPVSN